MFDAHNHFTDVNSILCTAELLPENFNCTYNIKNVATSEIGLDKRYEVNISEEAQTIRLLDALKYAKENVVPVTIHCVYRTEALIKALKITELPEKTVIWHGFNGSIDTARELNRIGVLISIGPGYNKNIKDLYDNIDVLLLESDYEGNSEQEHNEIINELYERVSNQLKIPAEKLEEDAINATKAFKNRITFR